MPKDEQTKGGIKGDLFQAYGLVEGAMKRMDRMWVEGAVRFRPEELKAIREFAHRIDKLLIPMFHVLDDFDRIAPCERNPALTKLVPLKELTKEESE